MTRVAEKRNQTVRHFSNLGRILNKTPEEVSEVYGSLKKIESRGHRLAEKYCNGDIDSDQWEKETEKIKALLSKILPEDLLKNTLLNGDPRGYFLKISDEYMRAKDITLERDWGGYGIYCPDEV
jgi:hypothetical protein